MNDSRKKYSELEHLKEIIPEVDLSKVDIIKLSKNKDQVRDIIDNLEAEKLSVEDREYVGFVEDMLNNLPEPGEEAPVIEATEPREVTMVQIVKEDISDTVAGMPTGDFGRPDLLVTQIRGCAPAEYPEKCEEAAKSWRRLKSKNISHVLSGPSR